MDQLYFKALLLHQRERHKEALGMLQDALRNDPNDPYCHGLAALCLNDLDRHNDALEAARKAVELEPGLAYGHFVLAVVYTGRERFKEAGDCVREAIRLDPEDADYHGMHARIEYGLDNWKETLAAAEEGLRHDPQSDLCRHWRAHALMMLGRKEEAEQDLAMAMAEDPNDPYAHESKGWFALHQGQPEQAKLHFLEALRLNPANDSARQGLAQALKSHHALFSAILRVLLYLGRFKQWILLLLAVGIGLSFYFGNKWVLAHPQFYVPLFLVKSAVWTGMVLLVLANPLFDLVLRLDREGRRALSPDQIRASNWSAVCIAMALFFMVFYTLGGGKARLLPHMAMAALLLTAAIRETFEAPSPWVRARMMRVTLGAAALIPIAYFLPLLFLILALGYKVMAPGLLRWAFHLLTISILASAFSENIRAYFEKRRPDADGETA